MKLLTACQCLVELRLRMCMIYDLGSYLPTSYDGFFWDNVYSGTSYDIQGIKGDVKSNRL